MNQCMKSALRTDMHMHSELVCGRSYYLKSAGVRTDRGAHLPIKDQPSRMQCAFALHTPASFLRSVCSIAMAPDMCE